MTKYKNLTALESARLNRLTQADHSLGREEHRELGELMRKKRGFKSPLPKAGDVVRTTEEGELRWAWNRAGTGLVQVFIPTKSVLADEIG